MELDSPFENEVEISTLWTPHVRHLTRLEPHFLRLGGDESDFIGRQIFEHLCLHQENSFLHDTEGADRLHVTSASFHQFGLSPIRRLSDHRIRDMQQGLYLV